MIKRLILTAALLGVSLAATAERPPQYFGLNGGAYDLESDIASLEAEGSVVNLRLGYELNRFLAFEARFGMDPSATRVAGTDIDARMGAGFVRLNLPLKGVDVYVLGGAGRVSFEDGSGGRDSEDGPAAGLGIELYGSQNTAVVIEGVRYEDDDEGDYKAYTIGFKHHFDWPALR